jgi:HemY protein
MLRLFTLLLVLCLVAAGLAWLAAHPGQIMAVWQGYRIEMSVATAVVLALVAVLVLLVLAWLLRRLLQGPATLGRWRREARRRRGQRALSHGMVAVAAGDSIEARRQARKAEELLDHAPLTRLLAAQAAQLEGDETAAERYFRAMLNDHETEFLGLRGLLVQEMRRGHHAEALALARRAYALRSKAPWVVNTLLELHGAAHDWAAAEEMLEKAAKDKVLDRDTVRRRRVVLKQAQADAALARGDRAAAQRLATTANKIDPGFVPAAVLRAQGLLGSGQPRKAAKVVEEAWAHTPHPDLAAVYGALFPTEDAVDRLDRFRRLVARKPKDPESHLTLAAQALAAGRREETRAEIEALIAQGPPTMRACALMAALEQAEGKDAAARAWLTQATQAPRDPLWVCRHCGWQSEVWAALCARCGAFDALAWAPPAAATLGAPLPEAALLAGPTPGPADATAAAHLSPSPDAEAEGTSAQGEASPAAGETPTVVPSSAAGAEEVAAVVPSEAPAPVPPASPPVVRGRVVEGEVLPRPPDDPGPEPEAPQRSASR